MSQPHHRAVSGEHIAGSAHTRFSRPLLTHRDGILGAHAQNTKCGAAERAAHTPRKGMLPDEALHGNLEDGVISALRVGGQEPTRSIPGTADPTCVLPVKLGRLVDVTRRACEQTIKRKSARKHDMTRPRPRTRCGAKRHPFTCQEGCAQTPALAPHHQRNQRRVRRINGC